MIKIFLILAFTLNSQFKTLNSFIVQCDCVCNIKIKAAIAYEIDCLIKKLKSKDIDKFAIANQAIILKKKWYRNN